MQDARRRRENGIANRSFDHIGFNGTEERVLNPDDWPVVLLSRKCAVGLLDGAERAQRAGADERAAAKWRINDFIWINDIPGLENAPRDFRFSLVNIHRSLLCVIG